MLQDVDEFDGKSGPIPGKLDDLVFESQKMIDRDESYKERTASSILFDNYIFKGRWTSLNNDAQKIDTEGAGILLT